VFNTHYLCRMYNLKVVHIFSIVDYGPVSISTDRGRFRSNVTSPVDEVTMLSYLFSLIFFDYLLPLRRYSWFSLAEIGEMTISAARGRARPEMTSQFDFLTPIWYRAACETFHLF
jgi:hypothetical protein